MELYCSPSYYYIICYMYKALRFVPSINYYIFTLMEFKPKNLPHINNKRKEYNSQNITQQNEQNLSEDHLK